MTGHTVDKPSNPAASTGEHETSAFVDLLVPSLDSPVTAEFKVGK
jgi:hypothetical protein